MMDEIDMHNIQSLASKVFPMYDKTWEILTIGRGCNSLFFHDGERVTVQKYVDCDGFVYYMGISEGKKVLVVKLVSFDKLEMTQ